MKSMHQDRIAFDRATVSARTFDEGSGHMHVAGTNISKACVNPYNGSEIPFADELGLDPDRVYRLLRHPDELAKAAQTFNGKPLLMVHRVQDVADGDHQNRVGAVANAIYEHPFLKADLAVWSKDAIDAVESGAQRELSCGYHYKPVMTPGSYEGEPYDGVMTEIGGNHVALVKEGRAGADCHVFDSMENLLMNRTASQSRAAIAGPIALAALVKPKLAKDAKINWGPLFAGVNARNFASRKPKMATDMKVQLKGKLAKDADIEDVVKLLDTLEDVIPGDGPDVEFKKIGDLPAAGEDPVTDADDTELRAFLKTLGLSDEDIDKACAMAASPAASEDAAPSNMGTSQIDDGGGSSASQIGQMPDGATDPVVSTEYGVKDSLISKDKKAMDALRRTVAGMDAKIQKARSDGAADAMRIMREIRDAERAVEPRVGRLEIACDSAEDVYLNALRAMNIDVSDVPSGAARAVFNAIPAASPKAPRVLVAQDEASRNWEKETFPHANRLKN